MNETKTRDSCETCQSWHRFKTFTGYDGLGHCHAKPKVLFQQSKKPEWDFTHRTALCDKYGPLSNEEG